jgi:3-methyladenine DNA glycosylase/8-oxoguanine DNA glycosylase
MQARVISTDVPLDLARTLAPLRRGRTDPTTRIEQGHAWRASRTPGGPATMHASLDPASGSIRVEAWGQGSDWLLDHAPGILGLADDDAGFVAHHDVIARLRRELPGVRLTRTERLVELLVPTALEQKVTGLEARRAFARMTAALSEPAPGPDQDRPEPLLLPPDPAVIAALPYHVMHPFGVERRRAETLRFACERATRIDALATLDGPAARAALVRFPGIGPWTAAEVTRLGLADADAVSVGDFHLPNVVTWALAGEPRGTDERMLELLEPYRGHRGRVQRLLEAGNIKAPRYGPRSDIRTMDRI